MSNREKKQVQIGSAVDDLVAKNQSETVPVSVSGQDRQVVGVLGGSFDPVHLGHLCAAMIALESYGLTQVIVVPTFRHAFGKLLSTYTHRMAMCRLAFAPWGNSFVVSDIERELAGDLVKTRANKMGANDSDAKDKVEPFASFTIHTLQALQKQYPAARLRLLIGSDILQETETWHRWKDIACDFAPIVIGRQGYEGGGIPIPNISSSQIRQTIRSHGWSSELVTSAMCHRVLKYASEHGLYQKDKGHE